MSSEETPSMVTVYNDVEFHPTLSPTSTVQTYVKHWRCDETQSTMVDSEGEESLIPQQTPIILPRKVPTHPCQFCEKLFLTKQGLVIHEKWVHKFETNNGSEASIEATVRVILSNMVDIIDQKAKEEIRRLNSARRGKETRIRHSVSMKCSVLDQYEDGVPQEALARKYNINRSLVSKWVKNKEKIRFDAMRKSQFDSDFPPAAIEENHEEREVMNHSNGRLMLKIKKKRRDSFPATHKLYDKNTINKENKTKDCKKRVNPFSKDDSKSSKIQKLNRSFDSSNAKSNFFFSKLDTDSSKHIHSNSTSRVVPSNQYGEHICEELSTDAGTLNSKQGVPKTSVSNEFFPLDWSIKQRIRFISQNPFKQCINIKSTSISKGISDFTKNNYPHVAEFSSMLHYWVFPNIPGVPNYPLKKILSDSRDSKPVINLADNPQFQNSLMDQWKSNFQSLFNMLKTGYCPYFYLCCYQFCALFKAKGIQETCMSITVTPTTKGFREMLQTEGISFEMPYNQKHQQSTTTVSDDEVISSDNEMSQHQPQVIEQKMPNDKDTDLDVSLNDSNNDDFLDSIGLNKQQHFPSIQEQQRLKMKKKLQQVDKRPESTIIIKNCQGFFNFLLNSTFLCVPSGNMIGVPPTLLSPSIFEGASLAKCKFSHGPVKHQNGSITKLVYCVDVTGFILPTQLKQMVDLLVDSHHEDVIIQTKSYDLLHPLNVAKYLTSSPVRSESEQFGMTSKLLEFMNHSSQQLPDACDIYYEGGKFKYS